MNMDAVDLRVKKATILGHFDKQSCTYLIWRDPAGRTCSEKVVTLAKHRAFLKHLSNDDAFLFGYLLGSEHERIVLHHPERSEGSP